MGFLDNALRLVAGTPKKPREALKLKAKKHVISKKKSVKKTKTIRKSLKNADKAKKTKTKVIAPMKKKPAKSKKTLKKIKKIKPKKLPEKKINKSSKHVQKKPARKHAKKSKSKKKSLIKVKVELIEEKLPRKRALALIKEPEVIEFIMETAGEDGYKTYEFLVDFGKEIDEYSLADKVQLQINYARSLLYKLYDYKLVSFFRERDKKKGWFIYSWNAHPEKLKYILIKKKEEKIEKFEKEMLKQQDSFNCPNCGKNFEYTEAIENMFFCSVCGSQLEAVNVSEIKKKLQKEIDAIKKEIAELKKI